MRWHDVGRRSAESEHCAHHGCTGDESEITRQVEHAGYDTPLVRGNICHHCGVVGRLNVHGAGDVGESLREAPGEVRSLEVALRDRGDEDVSAVGERLGCEPDVPCYSC